MNCKTGHMNAGLRRRVGADDASRSTRRKSLGRLGGRRYRAEPRVVSTSLNVLPCGVRKMAKSPWSKVSM